MIEIPQVVLCSENEAERGRWRTALAGSAELRECAGLAALEAALTLRPADVLVAPADAPLLEGIQRIRGEARLVLCGARLPPGVSDAAAQGYDLRHVARVEDLRREVQALARPRSLTRRHQLTGLTVCWAGTPAAATVMDISNGGLSFRLELEGNLEELLPGTVLHGVQVVRGGELALAAEAITVRYVELCDPGDSGGGAHYRIGCELASPLRPPTTGKAARITDGAARAGLLRAALRSGGLYLQDAEGAQAGITCNTGRVDLEHGALELASPFCPFEKLDVVRGTFELGGGSYRFLTAVASTQPLALRLPPVIEVAHRRTSSRYRPAAGQPVEVELVGPLLPGGAARRPVLELSSTGLSFAAHPEYDLFPPGARLTRVAVKLGGLDLCCSAEVKNLLPLPGKEGAQGELRCGLVFEGLDQQDRGRLADAVMRHRFPGLADGTEVPFEQVWRFFQDTRFLYPEKLQAIAPLVPEIHRTYSRLGPETTHLFKSLVYREQDKLLAHLSTVRAFRRTWVVQHLAGQTRRRGQQAPRVVNQGLSEYFGQNTDLEYVKVFFRPDNKWPARVFGGFARKVTDRQLSDLRRFHYLALHTSAILPGAAPDLRVIEVDGGDLSVVERHFVGAERGLLLRSDDLTRGGLALPELSAAYRERGLQRERRVLLALRKDLPVGFALCELSSPGLNLSELLSSFHASLLPGAVDGAASAERALEQQRQARAALVRAALSLYRRAGRPFAVGLFDESLGEELLSLPALSRKQYVCWTCHRTLYRRFCEHVDRLYEMLDADRRRTQPHDALPDGELERGSAA